MGTKHFGKVLFIPMLAQQLERITPAVLQYALAYRLQLNIPACNSILKVNASGLDFTKTRAIIKPSHESWLA